MINSAHNLHFGAGLIPKVDSAIQCGSTQKCHTKLTTHEDPHEKMYVGLAELCLSTTKVKSRLRELRMLIIRWRPFRSILVPDTCYFCILTFSKELSWY